MSAEPIIDTKKQRIVTAGYFTFLFGAILFLILMFFGYIAVPVLWVIGLLYFVVFFVSYLLGMAAKRGIDIKKATPTTKKITVSFDKYLEMVVKHEDAYGFLYESGGSGCTCMCMCFMLPLLVFLPNILPLFSPIFEEQWPLLYVNLVLLIIFSIVAYTAGFRAVKVDPDIIFKKPPRDGIFEYAEALSSIEGIRPEVEVTISEIEGNLAIMDATPILKLEGFPDEAQLKIQFSDSGFLYPYLVATYYKGPQVEKHKERVKLGVRYPALIEYMMDDEVTVLVGRFDIPKRSSAVPYISIDDFRQLAKEVVSRLRAMAAS
ncbi:MAG: hypothetical protein ACTSYL_04355 [Candidatus Thorarchaeota archaeon]